MLLLEHKIVNVGPFEGENVIEFSTDPHHPVTLIGGKNGHGKTTILESILLVLYGPRARNLLGFNHYSEFLRNQIHDGCNKSSISLKFTRKEQGVDRCYKVSRFWYLTEENNVRDGLEIVVDDEIRSDLVESWSEYVEQILPESLAGLFIFDGERIKELAEEKTATEALRSALFGLLGLDLVEKLQVDISELRQRVLKNSLDSFAPNQEALTNAEADLDEAKLVLSEAESDLAGAEEDLGIAQQELVSIKEKYSLAGGDLFTEREKISAEKIATEKKLETTKSDALKLAASELPLFLVEDFLKKILDVGKNIQKLNDSEFLRTTYKERDEFLLSRLEKEDFTPEQLAFIDKIMGEERQEYDVSYNPPFLVEPETHQAVVSLLESEKFKSQEALSEVLGTFEQNEKKLEQLQSSLAKVPTEKELSKIMEGILRAETKISLAEEDLKSSEENFRVANTRFEQASRKFEKLQLSILEESALDHRSIRIEREVQRAKETLNNFKTRIISSNLNQIQNEVRDALDLLYRKKSLVSEIKIDSETFEIELLQSDGNKINPERLSSGERQLLATSLLWGMAKVASSRLPMVLDTPLARLDSSHRERLVKNYFPVASHQVILLSTDEEIVGDHYAGLTPDVGSEYYLEHNEETKSTKIIDGYFPSASRGDTGELVLFPPATERVRSAQSE